MRDRGQPALARIRAKRLVVALAAVVAVVAAVAAWPMPQPQLCSPAALGRAEAELWRAYYERRHVALAVQLVRFNRDRFGLSVWDSVRSGAAAALAARRFQASRSRAEAEAALAALTAHFRVRERAAPSAFDPEVAARLELEWWQRRREGATVDAYAPLIAAATAYVHGIDPARVAAYSRLRADAMRLRDERGDGIGAADWDLIGARLAAAYSALNEAVAGDRGCAS
jgi:hypothetical protein